MCFFFLVEIDLYATWIVILFLLSFQLNVNLTSNSFNQTKHFHQSVCKNVNTFTNLELKRSRLLRVNRNTSCLGSIGILRHESTQVPNTTVSSEVGVTKEAVTSSSTDVLKESTADIIPEPPPIPAPPPEVMDTVKVFGGEPSFESLGLGGWTPVGLVQHAMEFLHVDCSLPWWCCIGIGKIFT